MQVCQPPKSESEWFIRKHGAVEVNPDLPPRSLDPSQPRQYAIGGTITGATNDTANETFRWPAKKSRSWSPNGKSRFSFGLPQKATVENKLLNKVSLSEPHECNRLAFGRSSCTGRVFCFTF